MKILITGGAGYIGSHTGIELLANGFDIVIADNFVNSSNNIIKQMELLSGKEIKYYNCDLCDAASIANVFYNEAANGMPIEGVIHFAGLKAVGESVQNPLMYYQNNILSTINLLNTMKKNSVRNIIFSSSATVYSTPALEDLLKINPNGITEDFPTGTVNPYGSTKLAIENMLADLYTSDPEFNIGILRYFNPIGAHPSGLIGENPNGIPNNLLPYISKVAIGELPKLSIFGNDYPTPDGTCIRDFIHVVDVAKAHIKMLEHNEGFSIYNVGTGTGYSVLDIVHTFEEVSGIQIPYEFVPRRSGDITQCWADPSKINKELHWYAAHTLQEMCCDAWNYIRKQLK